MKLFKMENDKVNINQPTLWDNLDLESGLNCLNNLKFDKALNYLSAAQDGPCNKKNIKSLQEATKFWKTKVEHLQENKNICFSVLEDWKNFPFVSELKKLEIKLFEVITKIFLKLNNVDRNRIEELFDLFLSLEMYEKAISFIKFYTQQRFKEFGYHFMLAQALWMFGNKKEANDIYNRYLLLCIPVNVPVKRIENKQLKNLINKHGSQFAPAYAWINGITSFIETDNIHTADFSNEGLSCYNFLQKAHKHFKNNNLNEAIKYRKKLKACNAILYDAYFDLIQKIRK